MYAVILAGIMAASQAEFRMNISLPFDDGAVILLELPVPEKGARYKRISVSDLRKHGRLISYLEYNITSLEISERKITRAVFHLPEPPDADKKKSKQVELLTGELRHGYRR